jgi:hypothetical protein
MTTMAPQHYEAALHIALEPEHYTREAFALETYKHNGAPPSEHKNQSSLLLQLIKAPAPEPHRSDAAPHSVRGIDGFLLLLRQFFTGAASRHGSDCLIHI